VFEYHGWITVRETATATDDDDELLPAMVDAIRRRIADAPVSYLFALEYMNGSPFVHIGGFHNHRNPAVPDLFRQIGRIAPGSYGLLHILDDEDPAHRDEVRMLTLIRGDVRESTETRMSPPIPTLEDAYPDNSDECRGGESNL
jgi:hypothetical protein